MTKLSTSLGSKETNLTGTISKETNLTGTIEPAVVVSYQVDNKLSDVSENPVQNKVITAVLKTKKDTTIDESIDSMDILALFN